MAPWLERLMALFGDWRTKVLDAPKSPQYSTLEAARARYPRLSRDEYTLARMIHSEDSSGTPESQACVGDAALNNAADAGVSVTGYALAGSSESDYGSQGARAANGKKRPVSTARQPWPRDIEVAIALMRAPFPLVTKPPARGISRGAVRFFSPSSQEWAHRNKGASSHCPAATILERWTFNKPWKHNPRGSSCELGGERSGGQEWVGPIDGVDPWTQMLMRPASSAQRVLYAEALKVIESKGEYKPPRGVGRIAELATLGLVALIAASAGGAL